MQVCFETVCHVAKRGISSFRYLGRRGCSQHVSDSLRQSYQRAKETAVTALIVPQQLKPTAIFANNELHLSEIDAYGFDYDYTLAVYRKAVNPLIYDLALRTLIENAKYPADIVDVTYDPEFAVRGIHYDVQRGLLLKLDSFCHIQLGAVYRGTERLSDEEVKAIYKGTSIARSLVEPFVSNVQSSRQFQQLLDLFSVPELGLLSNVIAYFTQQGIEYHPESLFHDVTSAVRSVHVTGQLYRAILEDRERFIRFDDRLRPYLERLKSSDKVIFLLTNSPFPFVNEGMKYLLGNDWLSLFDHVIVKARKPAFFNDHRKPFRRYHRVTDRLAWSTVTQLRSGKIYAEGNVEHFLDLSGVRHKTVLYFGDHMYSDLAEPMINSGWRTAAIVPELRREINILNQPTYINDSIWLQLLTSLIEHHLDEAMKSPDGIKIIEEWKTERQELRNAVKALFNVYFGSMFRTFHNPTYFSRRLMRLSDVYTSAVSNFDGYSLDHIFYTRRVALPHEFNISPASLCTAHWAS